MAESAELMRSSFDAGCDYVVCDSLAEATCSFLAQDRQRDEALGFAPDLGARLDIALPYVAERGTRWITNAGGVNPIAAHRLAVEAARPFGVQVGLVFADLPATGELGNEVYLGAAGVVEALDRGARVVITGRVADAALFLAPAVFEHGWAWDDWDRLAAGVVVGHLLECSAQASGGNYSGDWWNTSDPGRVGLPIAEVDADGTAVVTKPEGSAGRVSFDTVREQLLYEVHDPAAYIAPDVVADFTTVRLDEVGPDRVSVSGVRGRPRPDTLKGLSFRSAGWAGEATLTYSWPDAAAKGRHVMRSLRAMAAERELPVLEWWQEQFGVSGFGGPTVDDVPDDPPEVTSRLAWRCTDAASAAAVLRLVSRVALSGPPGLNGIGRRTAGGRSPVSELVDLEAFFVDRAEVEPRVRVVVE
jgi:hypothetical protein